MALRSRYILALDPSGNYKEGLGTTGWCLFDQETDKISKFGVIAATNYKDQYKYWDAHISLIDSLAGYRPEIVIEDYLLYSNRAQNQINSRLETPQLIGVLKYESYKRGLFVTIQTAMQVKTRWSDETLCKKDYLTKRGRYYYIGNCRTTDHIRDAVRHAIHFKTYTSRYNKIGGTYGKDKNTRTYNIH